jgi:hypothetical protein
MMRIDYLTHISTNVLTWVGAGTPLAATVISVSDVELALRITSLCIGLLVGTASFVLIRKKTKLLDKQQKDNEKDI